MVARKFDLEFLGYWLHKQRRLTNDLKKGVIFLDLGTGYLVAFVCDSLFLIIKIGVPIRIFFTYSI